MIFRKVVLPVLSLPSRFIPFCPAEVCANPHTGSWTSNRIIPWSTPNGQCIRQLPGPMLVLGRSRSRRQPWTSDFLPLLRVNPGNPPTASASWENDVGEKIPNWVESARLYYQLHRDMAPLNYVKRLVDYSLDHGQTPTNHAWPGFPVGHSQCRRRGIRGFTGVWALWDCHVDLAADIGFSMYRMYQIYGDTKYRTKPSTWPIYWHPTWCRYGDGFALALCHQFTNRGEQIPVCRELGWCAGALRPPD